MKKIGSEFALEPKVFARKKRNWENYFPKENKIFLSTGSDALVFLIKTLKIKKMMIPTYIEKDIIKLLLKQGIQIKFYKINKDLTIDLDGLKNNERFDSILVIHYFGFPHHMDELKKKCEQLDLSIIEDCVQSMLSTYKGKPVGTFGKASFNSLRKFVGIPDGSIVTSHRKTRLIESKNHQKFIQRRTESLIGKYLFLNGIPQYSNYFFKKSFVNAEKYHKKYIMPAPMSLFSRQILDHIDFKFIKNKRQQNFRYLLKHLKRIALFKKLPKNVCPLVFPIVLENRDVIKNKLITNGIFTPIHWEIKFYNKEIFFDAQIISKSILSIPIDQRYSIIDMKEIINIFRKLDII